MLIICPMFAFVLNPVGLSDVELASNPFFSRLEIMFSNFGGDIFAIDAISSNVK